MKKFSMLYLISFFPYILALFALPYMTARLWADAIGLCFIFSCCYQLLYIIYLRKKEAVTLGRSIGRYFLYLSFTAITTVAIWFADNFFNGYTPTTWVGGYPTGDTVYGFQAILQDNMMLFFSAILLSISLIYHIAYFSISRFIKNKSES